ncbi:MAG: poly-gamma-glutamate synthase PgsB [Candidatus Eisenbacteria bacterium]|nr:poly-gamma-glutamate synthase PgsB [Candidatus Eisenbacteria bacterium]
MSLFVILLAFVVGYWTVEAIRLHRALRAIPIRIHVNGSRGKSSVTRLIAAALREAGIRTAAKTTGSKARYIHPDGTEEPVIRLGTPNICEQVRVLDRARRGGARAIVMECMAIRPDLQRITEKKILRSTVGVITNVRADHLDVMGPTVADAAVAISSTIPRRGFAVAGDPRHADILRRTARRRGTEFAVARPEEVSAATMDGFRYLEHAENVAAVLAVTRRLGVDDETAIRGMHRVTPDPGACTRWNLVHRGVNMEFLNIFAANDLESTTAIWKRLGLDRRGEEGEGVVAILNLRADRMDRSLQFAEAVEIDLIADRYVIVGGLSDRVERRFVRRVPAERLILLTGAGPEAVFDRIAALGWRRARVAGVGNIGGVGHEILAYAAGKEKADADR